MLVFWVCRVIPLAVRTFFYKPLFQNSCFGTPCCNFSLIRLSSLIRLFCSYNRVAGLPLDRILNTKDFYHIIVIQSLFAADPGLVLCYGTRDCIPSIPTILKAFSRSATLPRVEKLTKPLELAMVGADPFPYLTN